MCGDQLLQQSAVNYRVATAQWSPGPQGTLTDLRDSSQRAQCPCLARPCAACPKMSARSLPVAIASEAA